MKSVILKIKGSQMPVGEEEDTIELMTEGKFYERNNAKYIVYEESELSGMDGCTTTLKILEDKIEMRRFGNATSQLVFEKGKRHVTNYSTPYGNFRMEILTKKLEYELTQEDKGTISIEYRISLQGLSEGTNKLDIEVM